MVENKTNWNTILIVLVVGVVGVLLLSNSGILTGRLLTGSYVVVANSCNADEQCETKSLIADSASRIGTVVINGKTISTKGGSTSALILTSDVKSVIVDGSLSANSVYIKGKTISTTPYSTSALSLTSDAKKVIVDGSLATTKLSGLGNAYACVNQYGEFYRSSKPCA